MVICNKVSLFLTDVNRAIHVGSKEMTMHKNYFLIGDNIKSLV